MASAHPTKEALIRTALALLEEHGDGGFTVDDVLKRSGISKGSLYHHFQDFDDLVDSAHIRMFVNHVDEDVVAFSRAIEGVNNVDEFLRRVELIAREVHSPKRSRRRSERVEALARAIHRKEMRDELATAQARMTESLGDLLREMQEREILGRDFSPEMYSTFVQAYSLGKILDDFSDSPIDPEEWTRLVVYTLKSWTVMPEGK